MKHFSRFLVIFTFSWLTLNSSTSFAWQDCQWAYRSQATITNNENIALLDYNVPIELNSASLNSGYDWNNLGVDLRVYDINNEAVLLPYYVEDWDSTNKTANLYVEMDLAVGQTKNIYIYHGNSSAADASSILSFDEPGIKFHTRNKSYSSTGVSPNSYNQAISDFNNLADNISGYGCKLITNFTSVRNNTAFPISGDSNKNNYIAYSESYFKVENNETGTWQFRYGSDFTYGGELRVDGNTLQERWQQDLWWGNNWNNTSEILIGSTSLTSGYHRLEIIGAEKCCDGNLTVQFKKPGGNWATFSTNQIDIRSRSCPINLPSVSVNLLSSNLPSLTLISNVDVITDAIAGSGPERALTGSTMNYQYTVTNNSNATVQQDTLSIAIPIPANTKLKVDSASFNDGSSGNESGLTFSYTSAGDNNDDIEFSTDGSNFNYDPTANIDSEGADPAITHIRLKLKGRINCAAGNNPTFNSSLQLIVK